MSAPSTSECNALRYFYPGSTARNGNLVFLPPGVAYLTGEDAGALLELDGVDMGRWRARYQHVELEGWAVVDDDTPLEFRADRKTLDISLERRADPPARVPPQGDVIQGLENVDVAHIANQADGARDGYFGVGIVGGKNEANQGTLWRSAYQLGAAFTYTVGARFEKSSADTTKTWTTYRCTRTRTGTRSRRILRTTQSGSRWRWEGRRCVRSHTPTGRCTCSGVKITGCRRRC